MWLLQTQLTDEMITAALEEAKKSETTVIAAAIGMISLFAVLLAISIFKKVKRNREDGKRMTLPKIILTFVVLLIPIGMFGTMMTVLLIAQKDTKEESKHTDEWHLVETTLTELEVSEQTTKHRRKKANGRYETVERTNYYYYAEAEGVNGRCSISQDEFNRFREGQSVYAVVDYEGNLTDVYSGDEYSYVGSRLSE